MPSAGSDQSRMEAQSWSAALPARQVRIARRPSNSTRWCASTAMGSGYPSSSASPVTPLPGCAARAAAGHRPPPGVHPAR
jgi:hypothetical protein